MTILTPNMFGLLGLVAIGCLCVAAYRYIASRRQKAQRRQIHFIDSADPSFFLPAQDVLEALPNPLLIVSAAEAQNLADKKVIFANAKARDFLKIPQKQALLLSVIRRPDILDAIDKSLFEGDPIDVNFDVTGHHDHVWRAQIVPLSPSEGRSLCLIVLQDDTQLRRNEHMRVDFLANASHELRTPLASLTGFIETLRGHAKDDAEARDRFLKIMAAQVERMSRLVDDLLSLSRIELNEHIPPLGLCSLDLLTKEVLETLSLVARTKNLHLDLETRVETDLKIPDLKIPGDRDQIFQVLQNLIDNAIKYSPDFGQVTIKLAYGQSLTQILEQKSDLPRMEEAMGGRLQILKPDRADHNLFVSLKVCDQGVGIERQHLPDCRSGSIA